MCTYYILQYVTTANGTAKCGEYICFDFYAKNLVYAVDRT